MIAIRWITMSLDVPRENAESDAYFWSTVLDNTLSDWQGDDQPTATLVPPHGRPWLQVQAIDSSHPRVHLDIAVDDPAAAAEEAIRLGAEAAPERYARPGGVVVLQSPAGMLFGLVPDDAATGRQDRTADTILDQVCTDVPSRQFDDEVDFWSAFTGWQRQPSIYPEFVGLQRPDDIPVRLSFQRVGLGEPRMHPDTAGGRRPAVVRRHFTEGAVEFGRYPRWTVMITPSGQHYCVTDRSAATGVLS